MFRKLTLKDEYDSEADNIFSEFFQPCLREAINYNRAVGYFSLGVLLGAPEAMSQIVENEGSIKLIFGKLVAHEDFEAIQQGMAEPFTDEDFPDFRSIIDQHSNSLIEYRIRILAWLFSAGRLEMKVALRPKGLFHKKIGIMEDEYGDLISFSGSMNETMSALDPRYNSEEITVFRSWNEGQRNYVQRHQNRFDKLWSGQTESSTIVCSLPEAINEGLNFVSKRFPDKPETSEESERVRVFFNKRAEKKRLKPSVPQEIHGNKFSMRPHQLEALRAWSENDYNGILELATGAGKTITAIYGATKTIEANDGIALVVAVPYQDLADQWCEELRMFNIHAVKCYGSRSAWEALVRGYLRRNHDNQREFIAMVVVNKTLRSEHFQSFASHLDLSRTFFIGDECHHHGSRGFVDKLLPGARFRIGLSATPFHYLDDEANERLRSVYDRSVYKYDLAAAVRDGVLTPYEYIPIPVELTLEETQKYLEMSDQIARMFASAKGTSTGAGDEKLKSLLMRRARLVGAAENKITELERLLDRKRIETHSLFYCSDGKTLMTDDDELDMEENPIELKQRHAVAKLLMQKGIKVSPFTAEENRQQRREILSRFKAGEIDALVAIRCLDEGIDVPACQTAYLIASSRNPRQFIQRRGRILRRSPGKEKATIYDLVVVMPEGHISAENRAVDFLRNELGRVADFASNSLYPASSIELLVPWLRKYDLEHLAV